MVRIEMEDLRGLKKSLKSARNKCGDAKDRVASLRLDVQSLGRNRFEGVPPWAPLMQDVDDVHAKLKTLSASYWMAWLDVDGQIDDIEDAQRSERLKSSSDLAKQYFGMGLDFALDKGGASLIRGLYDSPFGLPFTLPDAVFTGYAKPNPRREKNPLPGDFSVLDLLREIDDLKPGQVKVIKVHGVDGKDRYILLARGMNPNPFAWDNNRFVNAVNDSFGESDFTEAAKDALEKADIPDGSDVMMVGYSQGGMTVMNIAGDKKLSKKYNFTHVITVGSPVANKGVADKDTKVLNIEDEGDPVPEIDGAEAKRAKNRYIYKFGDQNPSFDKHEADSYASELEKRDLRNDETEEFFRSSDRYFHSKSSSGLTFDTGARLKGSDKVTRELKSRLPSLDGFKHFPYGPGGVPR